MFRRVITTSKAPGPPISGSAQAVQAGPLLFLSAQGGREPGSGRYLDSLESQTETVLENLKAILEEAGSSLDNLLERTVYLADQEDLSRAYQVIDSYFPSPVASTTIQVGKLDPERRIEIDVIAAMPSQQKLLIATDRAPRPLVRSSAQGVRAGPFVFVTGQGGRKPEAPPGQYLETLDAQLEQAVANNAAILEAGGLSLGQAVTATAYLNPVEDSAAARDRLERLLCPTLPMHLLQVKMLIKGKVTVDNVIALDSSLSRQPFALGEARGIKAGPWVFAFSQGASVEEALSKAALLLRRANTSLEQAVRLKLYLTGASSLAELGSLWERYIPGPAASTVVKVEGLARGARADVSLVALAPQ